MVYKVNVVTKDNLSEIRYITASEVISENVNLMAQIDAIRDIANNIMAKQPEIDYAQATKVAKEIRYGIVQKEENIQNNNLLPGIEEQNEQEEVLFGLEPAKQKILTKQ